MTNENALPLTSGVILLIEDDLQDVELFRIALAQSCPLCKLVSVQFAREAIKYLARIGEYRDEIQYPKPSLIVLDLSLPGMTGFEFLAWAQPEPAMPPIVVLSYSALEANRTLAEKFGARAYFVKSLTLQETVAMTKNLLLLNMTPPGSTEPNQNRL